MSYEIVKQQEILVAGCKARTNNADPNMGQTIGAVWQEFYEGGIYQALSDVTSTTTYGVYDNYESDASGEYDFSACAPVQSTAQAERIQVKRLPAGSYAKFDAGTKLEDVGRCWMEIWQSKLARVYDCDYEVYEKRGEELHISIYIHIQE